jgi:uncharacterized protein (TIGR00251 family)
MPENLFLKVKILPGSAKNSIVGWENDVLKIKIHAPPEKGKANKELISFLSEILSLAKQDIFLIQGLTSKIKTLSIQNITQDDLSRKVQNEIQK